MGRDGNRSLEAVTEAFVKESREILGGNLVGVYLHGSAAMGCFREEGSDIDLLVVVRDGIPDETKLRYMAMVVGLNAYAPPKGIEMSVVRRAVCRPFLYPTPFELHFSIAHLERYQADPASYVADMKGTDKDLAAHFMILWHRGRCLYGEAIRDVFEEVGEESYFDSIYSDVENAAEVIPINPVSVILNLCRVLAYKREKLILSKKEGAQWGLEKLPSRYRPLTERAMREYTGLIGGPGEWNGTDLREYAGYMLGEIQHRNLFGSGRERR